MTIFEQLKDIKLIPVIVLDHVSDARPLAQALLSGGLPCAEITFRTQAAAEALSLFSAEFPEILTGAGTILNRTQAEQAIAAGAKFLVSPGFNPAVVSFCKEKNIPIIPGAVTPTEIEAALAQGLTVVKFFPSESLGGVSMIQALSAPYPHLHVIPTGGITQALLPRYLENSRVLACGGSWMVPKDALAAKDFNRIEQLTAQAVSVIKGLHGMPVFRQTTPLSDTMPKCGEITPVLENHTAERAVSAAEHLQAGTPSRVVTFGEIMLRLAPEGYTRFVQSDSFCASYSGAEANTAISLVQYGVPCSFVSKVPAHEIGQCAVNALRRYGVDTSFIARGGTRLGIYYLEKGASQRPSKVIYDRAHSAIAQAQPEDFNWEKIFDNAVWFHFTGITPALGSGTAALCKAACVEAKKRGITVSCDLNYRKKLWSKEEAALRMEDLCRYVDVCIANEEDAANVFGIAAPDSRIEAGKLNRAGYESVAEMLTRRFGFRYVAITLRESLSASDNRWSGMLYTGGTAYYSKIYDIRIVDRVGSGDSFGAGLIYSLLQHHTPQECIDFAAAASCLKHSIEGDFNAVSREEVYNLVNGSGSGRVQR